MVLPGVRGEFYILLTLIFKWKLPLLESIVTHRMYDRDLQRQHFAPTLPFLLGINGRKVSLLAAKEGISI